MADYDIPTMLDECEENGLAPGYSVSPDTYRETKEGLFRRSQPLRTRPVSYSSGAGDVFVVSDLHLAAGRNRAGVYRGTENFFADDPFGRFLRHANGEKKTKSATLILNGDVFDFLRVTEYPGKTKRIRLIKRLKYSMKGTPLRGGEPRPGTIVTYDDWQEELARLGVQRTAADLERSVSRRERKYGLGTQDFKTVFKLLLIRRGHRDFFVALAEWLLDGNRLVIVKGNHDSEIYWRTVRNYIRLIIAEEAAAIGPIIDVTSVLRNTVLPNLAFVDDSLVVDEELYVEHGHRYDRLTMILDSPTLSKEPAQINIPFGSFFNRYLVNRVELYFPFFDKVRPSGNVLPILIRENFPLAMKVLFQHIPLLIRVLSTNLRYVWFIYRSVIWVILAIAAPFIGVWVIDHGIFSQILEGLSSLGSASGIAGFLAGEAKALALLILSYFFSRAVAWFQLYEPDSLERFARSRSEGTPYTIMTMGHTHNPGSYLFRGGIRFFNTGTWIPVIENSDASVREDRTFTFLHLTRDENSRLVPAGGVLKRWNDDAGRDEPQLLIESK